MKLHHIDGRSDWAAAAPADYNFWQRLAAGSRGVLTPGNLLTLAGFAIVLFGLGLVAHHAYRAGVAALVIGRLFDIADGWAADRTGTKSPLGEALDAGLDKVATILTVLVFVDARVFSPWVLAALVVPNIAITGVTLVGRRQGRLLHPSRYGKLGMAAAWLCIFGFGLARALPAWTTALQDTSVVLAVLSAGLGLAAFVRYVPQVRSAPA